MIFLYRVIAAIVGSLVILGCINIGVGVAIGYGIESADDIVGIADEAVVWSGV